MKTRLFAFMFVLLTVLTSVACSSPAPTLTQDTGLPNTKPTPQPGDLVQVASGLLPAYSVDDLIKLSEKIIVGTVQEIMPAQKGTKKISGSSVIFTDVLIMPEKYLLGAASLEPLVVRVSGGRVDGDVENGTAVEVEIYEDEPVFTLNESVLVFISEFSAFSDNSSYYKVVGALMGKYTTHDGTALNDITLDTIDLSTLETQISVINK